MFTCLSLELYVVCNCDSVNVSQSTVDRRGILDVPSMSEK